MSMGGLRRRTHETGQLPAHRACRQHLGSTFKMYNASVSGVAVIGHPFYGGLLQSVIHNVRDGCILAALENVGVYAC
jgi:hypothetical protein